MISSTFISLNVPLNLSLFVGYILAGYLPQNHNMKSTNFALERPESFVGTIVAPSVSVLPNCISGLGGIDSAGLQNGYLKDHFPGKSFHIPCLTYFIRKYHLYFTITNLVWSSH